MAWSNALPHPHTLSQFARRAGISEGRARALLAAGKLPRPDHTDAGGRPLWSATTIDAWCRQTGRGSRGEDVAWLYQAEPATEPTPVLFHGVIEQDRDYGGTAPLHAIVWDTPYGHLVYLTPVYDEHGNGTDHPDRIARAAAQLIQPAFWDQTLVIQPITGELGSMLIVPDVHLNLHRLEIQQPEEEPAGRLRRRRPAPTRTVPPVVRARFSGMITAADAAAVIGAPVPLWIEGTCTRAAVRRAQAYNATFTVPDTVTEWPAARSQIDAALKTGMPDRFPASFAALAAHTLDTLAQVQASQARQRDSGDGWHLAARPALPELAVSTELAITAAPGGPDPAADTDAFAAELDALRATEADLSVEAPEGDAYETAVRLMAWQLHEQRPEIPPRPTEVYGDAFTGPVIDQWRQTLAPVPDLETARRTRRVRRLLGTWAPDDLTELLHDPCRRYIAIFHNDRGELWFHAEWPYELPDGWNEQTIIAADPGDSCGAVFALTPTASGHMDVSPVPLEPGSGPSFGYGYGGGSPATLYSALIRVALALPESPPGVMLIAREDSSALWHAISTTEGPLRLPWPTVQEWARADTAHD